MDRRTVAVAALALLAVLALGVAAATLDSATTTEASGGLGAGDSPDDSGIGADDEGAVDLGGDRPARGQLSVSVCVSFLTRPAVQAALLLGVGLFLAAMYRTTRSWVISGLFVGAALFPLGVLYFALISCGSTPTEVAVGFAQSAAPNSSALPGGSGSAGSNAAGEAVSTPTALAGLLFVVAILGSVLLLVVSTGDDEAPVADDPPDLPEPERRREVGRRAGAAADRIEGAADLENEVYRAWREMTDALAVDSPRSTTPAEFADAAVAAGMDRGDVAALTEAFEAVRYGGEPATAEREREAVAALRRIEAAYAEGDGPGGGRQEDGDDGQDGDDGPDRPDGDATGAGDPGGDGSGRGGRR